MGTLRSKLNVRSIALQTYIGFEAPANLALRYLSPSRWLGAIAIAWGVVMLGMGFTQTYAGLIVARLFLGVTEVCSSSPPISCCHCTSRRSVDTFSHIVFVSILGWSLSRSSGFDHLLLSSRKHATPHGVLHRSRNHVGSLLCTYNQYSLDFGTFLTPNLSLQGLFAYAIGFLDKLGPDSYSAWRYIFIMFVRASSDLYDTR